jgi:hypothetical protein
MSKLIVVSITSALERYFALWVLTGLMLSQCLLSSRGIILIRTRIKEKLRSDEMSVSGDQWPVFLYHGYSYDHEDPWNSLFRSALLVSLSIESRSICLAIEMTDHLHRATNTYLHHRALSKKSPEPRDQAMRAFTG